jgi:hypothetical protein
MPLMPWQRDVIDTAMEIDPDTGRLAYREIILTVPRQSGKTSLILATAVHRALGFGRRQNITYAAQTRNDARKKWEDDHVVALENSALRKLFRTRKTNGNAAIIWRNGSQHGIVANTEKSGHGGTLDLAFVDEAFAQVDNRLEQAFKPAMVTRANAQMWVVSTAGTDASVYLKQKITSGRAAVEAGLTKGICYIEYSAPDDADPRDEDVWWACMPAVGHTIERDAIRADFASMDLVEFQRAYLNQWPDRNPVEQVIPDEAWSALADTSSVPLDPVAFAVDVNPERTAAAIAIAGHRPDGLSHTEVVDTRSGTGWVVARVKELQARHAPLAWVLDPASSAGSLLPDLQAAGIEPLLVTGREMAQACGAFFEDVVEHKGLRHIDQRPLNAALACARRRPVGDAWAWGRRSSDGDISPLVAVTLARHGLATAEPPTTSAYDAPDGNLMIV